MSVKRAVCGELRTTRTKKGHSELKPDLRCIVSSYFTSCASLDIELQYYSHERGSLGMILVDFEWIFVANIRLIKIVDHILENHALGIFKAVGMTVLSSGR